MREPRIEKGPDLGIEFAFIHGGRHAGEPLIPLGLTYREWSMSHSQSGVTMLLDVVLGPTQPTAEKIVELVPTLFERSRVEPADDLEGGIRIHVVVAAVRIRVT